MSFRDMTAAQQQRFIEEKRLRLRQHPATRGFLFEPMKLWDLVLRYRWGATGEDVHNYDDLRLSFEGYQAIAYSILFGVDGGVYAGCASDLTDSEKELIFFKHPLLSPKTFLMFERATVGPPDESGAVKETIESVPLYTYIAKKMLLFRIRIMLELAASVPPPQFRDVGAPVRCPPSLSSPLSNGLAPEDIERFIAEIMPNIRLVRDMPPWLTPYYLCHCSFRIMFALDNRGFGAVSIESLMASDVFSELLRMYESDLMDAVVAFPIGCTVDVAPQTLVDVLGAKAPQWVKVIAAKATDDTFVRADIDKFDGEGNTPDDLYTITAMCPKEHRVPEAPISRAQLEVKRSQLMWCPQTTEFLRPDLASPTNWFSLPLMHRVYEHFMALDVDGDGVLTKEEFSRYGGGSFTALAIARVFDIHVRDVDGRHAMDYKNYLAFVISLEAPTTAASLRYIWDVLDIEHTTTYIRVDALRCFCKELSVGLAEHGLMSITADNILSEVVDMINPEWHEWITKEDLKRCGHANTVLPILLNYRHFHAYDSREQSAASNDSAL